MSLVLKWSYNKSASEEMSLFLLFLVLYYLFYTPVLFLWEKLRFILFSSTAIGIRCKDGVVFGVEKLVLSKLYEEGSNKRLFNVDRHVGMVRHFFHELKGTPLKSRNLKIRE